MRLHRIVPSALALCLLSPLSPLRAQEFPGADAPEPAPGAPTAPAAGTRQAPTLAELPPVRVKLTAFGSPARLSVAASGAHAFDAATGEELPVEGGVISLSAAGKQVHLGEKSAATVRLEADLLTVGEGRAARVYPERLLISANNGRLSLVNECSLESYTQGVLCGECPASFHPEAIRAMAIAVRSYSYRKVFIARAELCDTTHCQVYRGLGSVRSSIRDAVHATAGTVATYDGEVIDAVYCSDCGGYTEANENAWKGAKPVPYLRPVEDAPEPNGRAYCAVNRSHTWSLTLPLSRLNGLAGKFVPNCRLNLQDLTASGRVRLLGIGPAPKLEEAPRSGDSTSGCDPTGEEPVKEPAKPAARADRNPLSALRTFTGEQWRRMFGLSSIKSLLFTVRTTDKGVEIEGRGWGHGVGLCQFGAHGMGLKGATCEEILKHYYTGVTLGPAPAPSTVSTPVPVTRRRLSRRPTTGRTPS